MQTTKDYLEKTIEVLNEREGSHGSKAACFETIADYWNVYIKHNVKGDLTPTDIALMMDLLKTARMAHGDPLHDDHYLDKIGYVAIAAEIKDIDNDDVDKRLKQLLTEERA